MVGHINFAGTDIQNIVGEISIKTSLDYNTAPFLGSSGSSTTYVSKTGRVITFKALVPAYDETDDATTNRVTVYQSLHNKYKATTGVLTSQSDFNLKGNYLFTDFEVVEDTGNNFECSFEFTEVNKFNSKRKTFRVWGNVSSSNKKKNTKSKKKPEALQSAVDYNTRILLTKCGVLKGLKENKSFICVKRLQRFLQKEGYYTKKPIDGFYGKDTKKAVKQFQTKLIANYKNKWIRITITKNIDNSKLTASPKLTANGWWDAATVAFCKELYDVYVSPDKFKTPFEDKVLPGGKVQ